MDDSSLYDNLLRATDNTKDILPPRYATITSENNGLYTVKEEETDLYHHNVPALNNVNIGDKVIILFINNNLYNPLIIGGINTSKDYYTKTEIDAMFGDSITYINR